MITADVWERFNEDLGRFIYHRVSDQQDAEDLLQDVFVKIHSRIDTLRDEDRLAPWIYQIARNSITDYYRTRKHTVELPETIPVVEDNNQEDAISQLAIGINEMIDWLPEIYRQPLILSEIKGMKQADVATHLGLSLSGAKSRIQRGRVMLRDALLECCHFEFDHRGSVIDYIQRQERCRQCAC